MLRQGRVPVNFRILEPEDGGSIQIIYAGASDIEVSIVGVVEGAGVPRNLRATVEAPTELRAPNARDRTFQQLYWWIMSAIWLFLVSRPASEILRHIRSSEKRNVGLLVINSLALSLLVLIAFLVFFFSPSFPTPPFGF
jgi:hypothetical protein